MGSFSGVKRGSKRSWVETERCLSCDLFCNGEDNGENDYDGSMFGGGGGKVLFQDDDDEEEEEEEVDKEDGGGDNMDYGNYVRDLHTDNDNDNGHGYDGKGMDQRCSVCTETKEKKRSHDSNIRTDTNNNSNQQLHCSCYQHKGQEQEHYSSCHSSNFNITNKKYENFRNYDENKFEIVGKIEESTNTNNNDNKNDNKSRNRRNERRSSLSHTKQLLCLKSRKLRDNSALIKDKYKPFNKKIENITENENGNDNKDGNGDGNNYDSRNNNSNVYKLGNNEYSRELN